MKNFGLRRSIVAMATCAAFAGGIAAMAGPDIAFPIDFLYLSRTIDFSRCAKGQPRAHLLYWVGFGVPRCSFGKELSLANIVTPA
mgnify:CR=1 FL=1